MNQQMILEKIHTEKKEISKLYKKMDALEKPFSYDINDDYWKDDELMKVVKELEAKIDNVLELAKELYENYAYDSLEEVLEDIREYSSKK